MAFQPIQMKPTGPSERVRNIISKTTLAIVAIICFYAGHKCISVANRALDEADALAAKQTLPNTRIRHRQLSGAGLPMALGIGLCGLGVITAAGAVMSWKFFDRFVKPPSNPTQRQAQPRDFFK